ncbi:MAG: glycosyltransferase [Puniceicoccales bacterium]|nr:glycosyltransferase [Puniceicoccales bacterium]
MKNAGGKALFSILIPTWNNLPYLQLCVASIRKNSRFPHQIIVHVNEGADGTADWTRSQGLDFTATAENVGVARAMNLMAPLAKTDYLLYLNDDMYVCPDWDAPLWEEIQTLGHHKFYLASTPIEPVAKKGRIGPVFHDFGRAAGDFRETALLAEYKRFAKPDWSGAIAPPCVVHRELWDKAEGYSEVFTTGYATDPDFVLKLWALGARYFKGKGNSLVYHFARVSTRKLARGAGKRARKLLLEKWGVTQEELLAHYLHLGEPWRGELREIDSPPWHERLRAWFWRTKTRWQAHGRD